MLACTATAAARIALRAGSRRAAATLAAGPAAQLERRLAAGPQLSDFLAGTAPGPTGGCTGGAVAAADDGDGRDAPHADAIVETPAQRLARKRYAAASGAAPSEHAAARSGI